MEYVINGLPYQHCVAQDEILEDVVHVGPMHVLP